MLAASEPTSASASAMSALCENFENIFLESNLQR